MVGSKRNNFKREWERCDEDDWFSTIGANQAKSTSRNDADASGFSRSEENVEASEYVLSAADD